ncbi:MAG TPA: metal-dependent transcriptional regulator [Gemmatimonadales bacterium]|nr:metal-dependent transcriptional regulator [Gemmatimonadales bacterium]
MRTERAIVSGLEYSTSVEDYLKVIHELSGASGEAVSAEVASKLKIARASVSMMVRRLAHRGLIVHTRTRRLRLTKKGRAAALRLVRRHRVLEAYLVTALGYPWDRVHQEAERLEHSASDELIDRMATLIGEPTVDPHGAPIPTAGGKVAAAATRVLNDLTIGEEARVAGVEDEDAEFLRYLTSLRLLPGTTVRLVGREPFGGSLRIRVASRTRRVGPSAAARVFVTSR